LEALRQRHGKLSFSEATVDGVPTHRVGRSHFLGRVDVLSAIQGVVHELTARQQQSAELLIGTETMKACGSQVHFDSATGGEPFLSF
jgi:hypothetical protein